MEGRMSESGRRGRGGEGVAQDGGTGTAGHVVNARGGRLKLPPF